MNAIPQPVEELVDVLAEMPGSLEYARSAETLRVSRARLLKL